jgi:hypothetical protein
MPASTAVITLDGAFGDADLHTMFKGSVTNGNALYRFPYNSWQLFPSGSTFDNAVSDLNGYLVNEVMTVLPHEDFIVMGFSLGAVVISGWLHTYGPTSTIDPSRLRFIVAGNSARRYGGVLATMVNSPPVDTPYSVLDVAIQYEGWCDWPTKIVVPDLTHLTNMTQVDAALQQLPTLAAQNAMIGANTLHNNLTQPWLGATTYAGLDLVADEYESYVEGNIEYRMYTTYPLPLLRQQHPFALDSYISQQDSITRPLVEVKYARPMDVPEIQPLGGISSEADSELFWQNELRRRDTQNQARLAAPLIQLWDGDFTLRGAVEGWRDVDWTFIENDTGSATLQLSLGHYLAKWVMNFSGRDKRNVIITIDKQGTRWSGFMDNYKVVNTPGDDLYLEITFKHDYEQLKHIYVWANPFLGTEVQFPKLWIIFGPAKWCLLMTLFVNILRLETSLWTLPDDPLDIKQWFPFSLNTGIWRNIVKPFPFLLDSSNSTFVFSRFSQFHDVAKPILEDAQLTIVCRRYLPSQGDPHPFLDLSGELNINLIEDLAALIPLREGCLVWDIVDNSGWGQGTSYGGSILDGLTREAVTIADDGFTQTIDVFQGNPTYPGDYFIPGNLATLPQYPWVVYDTNSPWSGIRTSEFNYFEATDTAFLTGGHSMPGVNEGISAGVNMAGDFLSTVINNLLGQLEDGPFGGFIQIPPLGGIFDALAKILYEDTFLAFNQQPTSRSTGETLPIPGLDQTPTGLGAFHYHEGWGEGADRANTLAALMALRAKIWATRAHSTHTIQVSDAAPYVLGEAPYGHFWLGNRIGTTVVDFPVPDLIFVERVSKIQGGWGKDGSRGWKLTVGYKEPEDPALKALTLIRTINQALGTLGIL